jgi:FixJ family two-component response regulator
MRTSYGFRVRGGSEHVLVSLHSMTEPLMRIPLEASANAKVHVVDEDEISRLGFVRTLQAAGYSTATYACVREFLLARSGDQSQCLLINIHRPAPSTVDLLAALARRQFQEPVVFMTGLEDVATSVSAMKAGAFDYLIKPVEANKLLACIQRAIAWDTERCASAGRLRLQRQRYERLTDRERKVMAGVVLGKRNKQVALELYMSERTVKAHRARLMTKLEAQSLADLVRISSVLGLASAEPGTREANSDVPRPAPSGASSPARLRVALRNKSGDKACYQLTNA